MYFLGGANTHAVDTKLVECAFDTIRMDGIYVTDQYHPGVSILPFV